MHKNQRIKHIALLSTILLLLAFLTTALPVRAQADLPVEITIYFFWGDGCPHCEDEWAFFNNDFLARYPNVKVVDYEVWNSQSNAKLFNQVADTYGFKPQGVPGTFVGDQYFIGYSDAIGAQIEAAVVSYMDAGAYPDPMARLEKETQPLVSFDPATALVTIPIFGTIDLSSYSLLASTVVISIIDGFNPCSLWVLSMLIALSLHTRSRRKVLLIGAVFLTVTAAVYAVFILGLFSMMSVINYIGWVQVVVSLVAATFAIINIKDYFWYKEGVSLTIADDKKPGIFKKMRNVVNSSNSFWGTIGATIVLAVGVSLVEFSCTAGLPMLWTNLLNTQQVSGLTFALLLLVYMFIYQIDELIIFIPAALTLRSSKFEEKQGRVLKLIGGILMLTLAVVLLVNPTWLNGIWSTLIVFGVSLAVSGLVIFLHKVILPPLGIEIGSDAKQKKSKPSKYRMKKL